jgi:hypothetical protein
MEWCLGTAATSFLLTNIYSKDDLTIMKLDLEEAEVWLNVWTP